MHPDDWQWRHPFYDVLVTIAEAVSNANLLQGNNTGVRQSQLFRVVRPGELQQHETKIGSTAAPLDEVAAWLEARISRQRNAAKTP